MPAAMPIHARARMTSTKPCLPYPDKETPRTGPQLLDRAAKRLGDTVGFAPQAYA